MQQRLSRRSVFAVATVAGALAASNANAGTVPQAKKRKGASSGNAAADHDHHMNHSKVQHGAPVALSKAEDRVVQALGDCETAGELCLSECISVLAAGGTAMADCARAVRAMLAVCRARKTLIESRSTFAGQQLALCRDACNACESECAKHKAHHESCRACAEACETAIKAIDRLLS